MPGRIGAEKWKKQEGSVGSVLLEIYGLQSGMHQSALNFVRPLLVTNRPQIISPQSRSISTHEEKSDWPTYMPGPLDGHKGSTSPCIVHKCTITLCATPGRRALLLTGCSESAWRFRSRLYPETARQGSLNRAN